MQADQITIGIFGAAGLAGGELLRLAALHPYIHIDYIHSHSHSGLEVSKAHTDLLALLPGYHFINELSHDQANKVDVVFLCVDAEQAEALTRQYEFDKGSNTGPLVIDLSDRNRVNPHYLYGLTETVTDQLKDCRVIANPGCFATAIQLPLLPFAAAGYLHDEVHVTAVTGSSGAGVSKTEYSQFTWRSQNLAVYKPFSHQHLAEMQHVLGQYNWQGQLNFIPVRGCMTRGIIASAHFSSDLDEPTAVDLLQNFYASHHFVHVGTTPPDIKSVVNTNHCFISVQKHSGYLHCVSVIDNLLKGAAGQALQNMNIAMGWPETVGLMLKPLAY